MNKREFIKAFAFIVVCIYSTLNAQVSNTINMMKYWNYRYDLIGDDIDPNYLKWEPGFLDLNNNQGGSMPANVQIWNTDNGSSKNPNYLPFNNDPHYNRPGSCSNQEVYSTHPNKIGLLKWGDAQVEFGKYLMILATEWKLLHNNNENTAQVEKEIYLAVTAAKRLDFNAELKFGKPQVYDGFFCRDDVPQDFAFDETRFGNRFHWVQSDWSCDLQKQTNSDDKCEAGNDPTYYGTFTNASGTFDRFTATEPSMDQIIYYLTGLYYIYQFVPTGLQHSPDPDITEVAKQQIGLTVHYLCEKGWLVKNPAGNQVCRGPSVFVYAWALFKMLDDLGIAWNDNCIQSNQNYLALSRMAWGYMVAYYNLSGWNGPLLYTGNTWSHRMNLNMMMNYGPLASDGEIMTATILNLVTFNPIPIDMGVTRRSLANWAKHFKHERQDNQGETMPDYYEDWSWFDVGGAALHGYNPRLSKAYYENRMGITSYECLGRQPFLTRPAGWDPTWPDVKRTVIAYDFMLMNNLTRLARPNTYPYWDMGKAHYNDFNNSLIREVTTSYPFANFGTNQNPLYVQAAYIMNNRAKLYPNSRVEFSAPHINLEPGFVANYGSTTTIYNDRMDCSKLYNDGGNVGALVSNDDDNQELDKYPEPDSADVEKYRKIFEEKIFEKTDDPVLAVELYFDELMANPDNLNEVLKASNLPEVKSTLSLELSPNPTTGSSNASFKMFGAGKVWMTLFDNMGIPKQSIAEGFELPAGIYRYNIDVTNLTPGIYSVVLRTETQQASKNLVIQK